ncbi:hypothetical protein MHB42_08160 [Lysinibacillus sp. FSL K6-0232]|uniref:hypothetical protein n=1 Tax=unclassified Lysinibacillus TaxID=2636778 RepID=UPI0030F8F127
MKKLVLSTLLITFLHGCNGSISNPEGKVIVAGEQYVMIPHELEWSEDNIEIKDLGSPDIDTLADEFPTLEVEKGESLKFDIDQNPLSITVIQWNEDGSSDIVEMDDNQITAPTNEGYYIYELKATWDKGKESFIFDVDVR